jgi:hypothetical protein
MSELAADLVRRGVAVIATPGTPSAADHPGDGLIRRDSKTLTLLFEEDQDEPVQK